jgi:hypothetical protein
LSGLPGLSLYRLVTAGRGCLRDRDRCAKHQQKRCTRQ